MPIPASLKKEHHELHSTLERATQEKGELGEAARRLADRLFPHFTKEEEFALPPLGLLALSKRVTETEIDEIISMTGRLGNELACMLQEHEDIAKASLLLAETAEREGKEEYVGFAQDLMDHARMEEEIIYPAALLIGSYLRLRKGGRR